MNIPDYSSTSLIAAITSIVAAPLALLVGVFAIFKRRPRMEEPDSSIEAALQDIIEHDSSELKKRRGRDLIDFRPSEYVRLRSDDGPRVEIVRTIQAALDRGYRVRIRATSKCSRGRVFVRSIDVDLTDQG
jgi:hypothetical protein